VDANHGTDDTAGAVLPWHRDIHRVFGDAGVRQVAYVPDAGLTGLIDLCEDDAAIEATVLTIEAEGVGLLAGAWLGGQRGALLMQSSGVGNCVNVLGLARTCRVPLLMVVTMRGEWEEFNPWQVPMGQAAQPVLETMGTIVTRADDPADAGALVASAATMAFEGGAQSAVLISQRLIGAKTW
jgi:sulfopyruvate decarboxylase alpha subunit